MGMRTRVSLVFAALLVGVWGVRCSSSSSGTGGTGSGGTGVDAGTGSGGTDGGGISDGGTDAGSSGGGTDGGTDGGSGGGGGGGGGTDDCAGVVPAQIGSSFTFDVAAYGSTISCDQVFSDESGNLAASGSRDLRGIREWHLFDSNGAALTWIRASDLFGQGPGYEGLSPYDTPMGEEFLRVAYWTPEGKRTDGSPVSGDMGDARAFRAPGGILVVKAFCLPPNLGGTINLRRFDPVTNETASTTVSACEPLAEALVDANQNWLLLLHGGPSIGFAEGDLVAQWFDPTGHSLTGWFRVAALPGKHTTLMHATIGGGAALRIDDVWTYFFPSGKSEVQPAQEFLASHPESDFNLIRGARAYAVFPRSGDTTQMELYSASGKKCGSLTFPRGNLTTGSDGSAIASSGDNGCTKTVWPALLK